MSLMLINSVDGARHYFRNLDLLLVGCDQKCTFSVGLKVEIELITTLIIMLLLARFSLNCFIYLFILFINFAEEQVITII